MSNSFERNKDPKASIGIGTITKIETILSENKGVIISYDDFIKLDIYKYTNNYKICVVINPDGSSITIENNKIGEWRKTINDLHSYIKSYTEKSSIDYSALRAIQNISGRSRPIIEDDAAEASIW